MQRKDRGRFRTPELFVESLFVACLLPGDSHIAHADNERRKRGRWGPNHTPQRDYTGLLYLNDNFTGGELVFPDGDVVIIPKPGLLVGFLVIMNLSIESQRFFLENDILCQSVYGEPGKSHAGLKVFQ